MELVTNIVPYLTDNLQNIYDRIKKLYELEREIDDDDDQIIPELTVTPCPSDVSNLATYDWVMDSFRQLQHVLNKLISLYNAVSFVNIDTYEDTQAITLTIPRHLLFDDERQAYFDSLFNNINSELDKLTSYANENR